VLCVIIKISSVVIFKSFLAVVKYYKNLAFYSNLTNALKIIQLFKNCLVFHYKKIKYNSYYIEKVETACDRAFYYFVKVDL